MGLGQGDIGPVGNVGLVGPVDPINGVLPNCNRPKGDNYTNRKECGRASSCGSKVRWASWARWAVESHWRHIYPSSSTGATTTTVPSGTGVEEPHRLPSNGIRSVGQLSSLGNTTTHKQQGQGKGTKREECGRASSCGYAGPVEQDGQMARWTDDKMARWTVELLGVTTTHQHQHHHQQGNDGNSTISDGCGGASSFSPKRRWARWTRWPIEHLGVTTVQLPSIYRGKGVGPDGQLVTLVLLADNYSISTGPTGNRV